MTNSESTGGSVDQFYVVFKTATNPWQRKISTFQNVKVSLLKFREQLSRG